MLNEGEHYDIQSKELNQMQSVIFSATDYISRVREAMEEGNESELAELNELLGEADEIPVQMEEVQLLRAHMQGIKWSENVATAMDGRKPSLQEAQKFLKEVCVVEKTIHLMQ